MLDEVPSKKTSLRRLVRGSKSRKVAEKYVYIPGDFSLYEFSKEIPKRASLSSTAESAMMRVQCEQANAHE